MKIIASIGDAFDGQFALRLKASARALGLECELFDRTPRGRDRTRLNALIRGLSDHRGEDLLYVDPDAHQEAGRVHNQMILPSVHVFPVS